MAPARKLNMIRGNTARRHLLCHPALGLLYLFPTASPSSSERQRATERRSELGNHRKGSWLRFGLQTFDV